MLFRSKVQNPCRLGGVDALLCRLLLGGAALGDWGFRVRGAEGGSFGWLRFFNRPPLPLQFVSDGFPAVFGWPSSSTGWPVRCALLPKVFVFRGCFGSRAQYLFSSRGSITHVGWCDAANPRREGRVPLRHENKMVFWCLQSRWCAPIKAPS